MIQILRNQYIYIYVYIYIIDPGQLSPYDFAIDCCKSKGVPRLCHGACVPGGAVPISRKRLKCSKHSNEMYSCKRGRSIISEKVFLTYPDYKCYNLWMTLTFSHI